MPLILVTPLAPFNQTNDAAKKFLEVMEKYPQESFEKNWLAGVKSDEDGIKTVWLTEIERGKLEEALILTAKREAEYIGIEGYGFKMETLMSFEDAMPIIGLEAPSAQSYPQQSQFEELSYPHSPFFDPEKC